MRTALSVADWFNRKRVKYDRLPLRKVGGVDYQRQQKAELRRKAATLAGELREFVRAQRSAPPSFDESLSLAALHAMPSTFDPTRRACEAYRVQFKGRVDALYSGGGATLGGSELIRKSAASTSSFLNSLSGLIASPPEAPTTLNEILAVGFELELKASRLPSD